MVFLYGSEVFLVLLSIFMVWSLTSDWAWKKWFKQKDDE